MENENDPNRNTVDNESDHILAGGSHAMNTKRPSFPLRHPASPLVRWQGRAWLLTVLLAACGASATTLYYVNDSSTNGDLWCKAPGNSTNSGTSAFSPKASLQSVLNLGRLNSGDTVFVDTGYYSLSSDVVISNVNASAAYRVSLRGAPGATVLDRGGASNTCCLSLRSSYVLIDGFTLQNANVGLSVEAGTCREAVLANNICRTNAGAGIQVQGTLNGGSFQITRNLLYANGAGMKLERDGGWDWFFVTNNTVAVTSNAAISIAGYVYNSILRNNILDASGSAVCLDVSASGVSSLMLCDFNDLYAHDGGSVAKLTLGSSNVLLSALADWQRTTSPRSGGLDLYSFTRDPAYADPAAGDYHLKSKGGRWVPSGVGTQGLWTADSDLHSPCVDTGNPGDSAAAEPEPNGGRINIGADGGTGYASKSCSNRVILAYAPDSGQVSGQTQPIRWTASGLAWNTNSDMVRIDYSLNSGTWISIVGGVPVKQGYFNWSRPVNTLSNQTGCSIRVAYASDTSVASTVTLPSQPAASGGGTGGAKTYYVNDGLTNGDLWCSQPGSDALSGLSPSSPVASLQTLLSRYTLGAGDTVLVDAGHYDLSSNIVVESRHGGNQTQYARIVGAKGATVFDRQSRTNGCRCIELRGNDLSVEGLTFTGGEVGLYVDASTCRFASFDGNACYNNSSYGLQVQGSTFSNGLFRIGHHLLYGNGSGMALERGNACGDRFEVTNNTVAVTGDVAIAVGGNGAGSCLFNNILAASGGACCLEIAGPALFASDYNDLFTGAGGNAARCAYGTSAVLPTLAHWQRYSAGRGSAQDQHSFSLDPAFADPDRGDYHLKSKGGRWQTTSGSATAGTWVVDSDVHSPCVDTGCSSAGAEPAPNGNRINLGCHGGTAEASKSLSGRMLVAMAPDSGQDAQQSQSVTWALTGQGWSSNETVRIDYSVNGGVTWIGVQGAQSLSAANSYLSWWRPADSFEGLAGCWLRVTANADTNVNNAVWLPPLYRVYYVNDASASGDLWCKKPGSDANDGLSPSAPAASLQAIVNRYTLSSNDTVLVDAGYYSLPTNIVIGAEHGGGENQLVRILGADTSTVFHRESQASDASCLEVSGNRIEISGFTFKDAGVGVVVDSASCRDLVFKGNALHGNAGPGLRVLSSLNWNGSFLIAHNRVFENGSGLELELDSGFYGDLFSVSNNTVAVTDGAAVSLGVLTYGLDIRNNILAASGSGVCLEVASTYGVTSDYNDFYAHDGGAVARVSESPSYAHPAASGGTGGGLTLNTLAAWQRQTGANLQDAHSIERDPLFASTANGDYHLLSKVGRWNPAASQWVTDSAQSPCIDAGDPDADASEVACEPWPNGSRLNLGAFGGTGEASKTDWARTLQVFAPDSGQSRWSSQLISWNAIGQAWQSNDTVRIDFSLDEGTTWTAIQEAQTLPASENSFNWWRPSDSFDSLKGCWMRVTAASDTSASGIAKLASRMRPFYVNDSGPLNGELWCTQPGSDANDGLTPATPLASLQTLLARYNLVSRDIVFVDAGYYALTSNVAITSAHSGNYEDPVRLQGANRATVFDRGSRASDSYGVELCGNYVTISGFTFANAAAGIQVWNDSYLSASIVGNTFRGNSEAGFRLSAFPEAYGQFQVANNVFYNNGSGLILGSADTTNRCSCQVLNNTFAVWQGAAVTLGNTWYGASVQNNIFEIAGSGCGLDLAGKGLGYADYNDYYVHDGGVLIRDGRSGNAYSFFRTLSDWQSANMNNNWEAHSFSRDPLFASTANGDYHLRSRGGRWLSSTSGNTGAWVTDSVQSPCVDAGSPNSQYALEPQPNGGCINMGAYGNTAEASKATPFRMLVLSGCVVTNAPLSLSLAWAVGGRGWSSTDTVRLEFSADTGRHWYAIPGAGSLSIASAKSFYWIVTAQTNVFASASGGTAVDLRVRVVCNQDAGTSDAITLTAKLPTATRTYYVNDASLTGDLYCTAPGSPANDGLSAATPLESLAHVLGANRLGAGDVVYVDTGVYTNGVSALAAESYGTADRPILILGSTNGTVLNLALFGMPSNRTACLELHGDFVRVERLTCVGAKVGISVDAASCRNAQLVNNVCVSNQGAGIEISLQKPGSGNEYLVLQNLLHHNGTGLSLLGTNGLSGSRAVCVVENNTIAHNSAYGIACKNPGSSGWRTTSLKNNAIHAAGANAGCLLTIPESLTYSDFNNLYATAGAAVAFSLNTNGAMTASATLTDWQAGATLDLHSLSADSRFADPTTGDYRLLPGSPCIDAGVLSSWMNGATDLAGHKRVFGASVDIGAYELNLLARLKLFLQGPFLGAAQHMSAKLSASGRLPLNSPYAVDPRAVSTVASGVTDWVLVQFRAALDGPPVYSRSAFLRADGQVLNDDGTPGLSLNLPPGTNYYVAVKHRNHLPALSAAPVAFTNDTLSYDFTVSSDRYTGGSQAAVEVSSGTWASAAGDADGDGAILPADLAICDSQANLSGYHRGDVDLDLYATAAGDRPLILANLGRAPGVPRPETVLLPMLRITPPQATCLTWETNTFMATVTSSLSRAANTTLSAAGGYAVSWTFVTNASGATLLNGASDSTVYTAGCTTGQVDVLEAWNPANDALGRASVNVISSQEVARAGQVMIVAGRKSATDPLWPTTDYLTDLAYNSVRYLGFSKADIHYLNPETDQDVDGNGAADDIACETTHANVAVTLTNACATANKLFIYLSDHGGDSSGQGFFRLNAQETLSAAELRSWLDTLQDTYKTEVTVLLDFCYAGSFMDELNYAGTNAVTRIIIASCSSNQPSYFVAGGLVSFSDAFFSGLLLGSDVMQCFDLARSCMATYQAGQLDDNYNGLYDAAIEGAVATGYHIGPSNVASGDQPAIGEVCGNQVLTEETSATLWVSGISAPNPVDHVWCVIVPPGFDPSPEQPVTDLPQLDLVYDAESGRYTITYDNFTAPGTYLAMFYARDVQGRVSSPRQCYVAQVGYDDRLILVAGGPTNTPAWSGVDYLASLAQTTFRLRLFDRAHTHYLSPGGPRDLDLDGTNDVDALPGLATLHDAIMNWALTNSTDRLTLYLVGTGATNTFLLNGNEALDGGTLASWLDAFQTTNDVLVNVILDFDGAGAFIPALATTNPATGTPYPRIVAAACQANRQAVHENGGTVSFSQYFLSGVIAGETFGDAFTAARRAVRRVTADVRQRAELDDTGNGLPNEKNTEGALAGTVYLGSAFLTGSDTPVIGAVTPLTVLPDASTALLLWASDVGGIQGISNVWCAITPPAYDGLSPLPFVELAWNSGSARYEALYSGFTQPGSYSLTFYAMDNAGELSGAVQSEVLRADPYEPDDDAAHATLYLGTPQIHTFHSTNDADWVRFYVVTNFVTYDITAEPLSTNLDVVVDLYRQLPDGTLEQVESLDDWGKGDYEEIGLYPGSEEYPAGFYYARITPYAAGDTPADRLGTYEFSVDIPVGDGLNSLIVLGLDDVVAGALPTGATVTVQGQGTKSFSGSTSVVYSSLTNGTYLVTVPTPTNFFPREDPVTPNQVPSLTNTYYANPRRVPVSGGWRLAGFELISAVNVTSGIVRDAWTHAFLGNAQIAFTAASGSLTGTVVDGSVILTNYRTNWLSSADGRLPSGIVLGACNWNLSVALSGYQTYQRAGAVSNAPTGSKVALGTLLLVPVDANSNAVADAWESQYFPGGMVATNDSDHDGLSNLQEYLCGTDPTNALSVLRFLAVTNSAGVPRMTWSVAGGRSYQVLSVTSLTALASLTNGPWEAARGQATMDWSDTDAPLHRARFYRIRLNTP